LLLQDSASNSLALLPLELSAFSANDNGFLSSTQQHAAYHDQVLFQLAFADMFQNWSAHLCTLYSRLFQSLALLFHFFLGFGELDSQLVDVFSCVLVALQVVGALYLDVMETGIEILVFSECLLT
jgi:hypothetical protein